MTPDRCRQARELLGWSRSDLAVRAHCSSETVKNFESGKHQASAATRTAVATAFTVAGVEFISENGGDAGVRMRGKAG